MKKPIVFSIALIGFTAMASQIVLIRELLIVFCGNELSLAFILASWLIGGAIGSAFLGAHFADRLKNRMSVFIACQVAVSILFPLSVMAVRSVRLALGVNPGEIVPIFPIACASLIILLPICTILGFMFSLASRVHRPEPSLGASRIGEVYIMEAVGAMIGGVITSFILIRYLNSMQIMGALGSLMLISAVTLSRSRKEEKSNRIIPFLAVMVFSLYIILWLFSGWKALDEYFLKVEWRGSELLASKNSIYGNVAVTKKGNQFSFFDNGLYLYAVPDRPTAEEAAHFALLEHPAPKKVLLIGGGAGGLLDEIARHPVEKIDYVELDPLILKMAEEHLSAENRAQFLNPGVSVIFEDGRRYIKRTSEKYDCVIINLGDPYTAQMNRFYTLEFYNEVRNIMNDGGVLSFGLSASESYIGPELADFLRSIYATLEKVFPDIKVIPGETAYFLASPKKGVLTYDYNILMDRAKARGLKLKYVREYYLVSRMSNELISYTDKIVKDDRNIRINRDFRPSSYYYRITAWAARFKDSSLAKTLKTVNERVVWSAVILVLIAILAAGFILVKKKKICKVVTMLSVSVNGFSQMSFQIIILLSFQMIYGFIFYKLGIILTAFMAGIALGGLSGLRVLSRLDQSRNKYALITLLSILSLYPLLLLSVLSYLSCAHGEFVSWLGSNVIFLMLPLLSGFLGGFIFPIAGALCLNNEEERGHVAGINYGRDLFGSCIGALVTGLFLLPILGLPKTCLVIAALSFKTLIVLIAGVIFS
ncbi:MAG: hypothetical protein NTY76_00950 [Candidatus Omnitrophica bacterium]|nr:hypothetical protein [Candidatus Omnitrophota bacterium]